ncbi:DUF2357 domain-containing protein [Filimonas effusa]|uniref:DUF2357 domain-containing protein n=1 Tax=Filimonas effusa TaxID=2508721 RepID=A0A4Q1D5F4_9BACT|nr:DUF2357 domain-containing protein [Filimonas effusa]RXK83772.1 DUF2357 domain-containing protein [Filimonas effusa]
MQRPDEITVTIYKEKETVTSVKIIRRNSHAGMWKLTNAEAKEFGEAIYQIQEGCSYEYHVGKDFKLKRIHNIIQPSKFNPSIGIIQPGNYVGTLTIWLECISNSSSYPFKLEVRSKKTDYRTDYRLMLEEITTYCTDLIMTYRSPVIQKFTYNPHLRSKSIYQRFAFIKSILDTEEFWQALHQIEKSPGSQWSFEEGLIDIRKIKRLSSKQIRQLSTKQANLEIKLPGFYKRETLDTPENRFIKHALQQFLTLCLQFHTALPEASDYKEEASLLVRKLEYYISASVFKEIGKLNNFPLNSPILQRKAGYREVLHVWLIFELAALLCWEGGEDVYEGGKRDVAQLYEYWLYFKLIDVVCSVFELKKPEAKDLIEPNKEGLLLRLKSRKHLAIEGIFEAPSRRLNVQLSYNRTFSHNPIHQDEGSWSTNMRPDYTLSIWPYGIEASQAEREELIVHLHFDAKYRVDNLQHSWLNKTVDDELDNDKETFQYKNSDLIKMHAYRDAIRRTAGAYVLYPGQSSKTLKGYHEILPGLGAFAINPSKKNNGIQSLKAFLKDVVELFLNRASQREKMAFQTYSIYGQTPAINLKALIPETYGPNRSLLPEKTRILIGYYKGKAHLEWIQQHKLYNTRIANDKSSIHIDNSITSSSYLLLYTKGEEKTLFYKLNSKGPQILTKKQMLNRQYPSKPTQEYYLVFEILEEIEKEFELITVHSKLLTQLKNFKQDKTPFSTTLTELLRLKR